MTIAPLSFPKTFYGDMPAAPAASPLSHAHLGELELANKRAKKIRRAVRIAQTDAWVCGIFAALTLLSGIFSLTALLLGLGLALCRQIVQLHKGTIRVAESSSEGTTFEFELA